jgi:hypothetical protein
MSSKLMARLVPSFDTCDEQSPVESEMALAALNGVPFLAPKKFGQRVLDRVGADGSASLNSFAVHSPHAVLSPPPAGLQFIRSGPWNPFLRPKVAMIGGWGAPGTIVCTDEYLTLVDSFGQVLDDADDRILNLQMFHREDEPSNGVASPPVLPELLDWPCDQVCWCFTRTGRCAFTVASSAALRGRSARGHLRQSYSRLQERRHHWLAPG